MTDATEQAGQIHHLRTPGVLTRLWGHVNAGSLQIAFLQKRQVFQFITSGIVYKTPLPEGAPSLSTTLFSSPTHTLLLFANAISPRPKTSHKMAQTRRSLRRHGNTVSFHDEPLPSWGSADVLIRVRAVSLNWKDAALVDGRMNIMRDDDRIVGTEFSGEVVSAGDSVTLFKVGTALSTLPTPQSLTHNSQAGDRVVSLINFKDITGREKDFIGVSAVNLSLSDAGGRLTTP